MQKDSFPVFLRFSRDERKIVVACVQRYSSRGYRRASRALIIMGKVPRRGERMYIPRTALPSRLTRTTMTNYTPGFYCCSSRSPCRSVWLAPLPDTLLSTSHPLFFTLSTFFGYFPQISRRASRNFFRRCCAWLINIYSAPLTTGCSRLRRAITLESNRTFHLLFSSLFFFCFLSLSLSLFSISRRC